MKILFLNSAGVWGGNEKWTHMAATSLSREHSVFLAYKSDFIGTLYPIKKIKLPFRWSFDPQTIISLISFVQKHQIDILIPTKKRDYVIAGLVARRCKKKNIIRLGIVRRLGRNPYKKFVYDTLTHGIIVNAQKIKEVLVESHYMSEQKIQVIYNGLDIEALDSQSYYFKSFDKPFPFMICTVGRLSKRKGLDRILKIFAGFIRQIHPEKAGLTIIGSGKRIEEFKALTRKLGISELVHFTGFINNPYPYLRMSDVYLTLSKKEGLSNSLLEAMYLDNAIVTSRAGGADEIITDGKNGFLLEGNTIDEGITRLSALYSDNKLRESLAKAAKQTVMEKCSMRRMTSEIIQFCSYIANQS